MNTNFSDTEQDGARNLNYFATSSPSARCVAQVASFVLQEATERLLSTGLGWPMRASQKAEQ